MLRSAELRSEPHFAMQLRSAVQCRTRHLRTSAAKAASRIQLHWLRARRDLAVLWMRHEAQAAEAAAFGEGGDGTGGGGSGGVGGGQAARWHLVNTTWTRLEAAVTGAAGRRKSEAEDVRQGAEHL